MARYTGPATRKSRRLGVDLVGGDQSFEKRPYPPGQHGRARIKESEYRQQLQEKQKARFTYGVMEKQFRRYYEEANRQLGQDRREPAADPGEPAGQRRVPRRPGPHPPDGPPAGQPRPLHRQRCQGRHPELPGVAVRHHRRARTSRSTRCRSRSRGETAGDRPIPAWLQVVGERQRILVHQLPERAQIDVPLAEQLIVEFYSK